MDMSTQTDMDPPPLPQRTSTVNNGNSSPRMSEIPENKSTDDAVKTAETINLPEITVMGNSDGTPTEKSVETPVEKPAEKPVEKRLGVHTDGHDSADEADDADNMEEPVIQQIHHASTPQIITRARLVTVVKPTPPKLPPRNPIRDRKTPLSINSNPSNEYITQDQATGTSSFSSSGRPSPSSLPDRSSIRSRDSMSSDDGLEAVAERFKPREEPTVKKPVDTSQEKNDEFHLVPESPTKHVPGGFN